MVFKTTRREAPAVNAGSMADIAFLLLIFFLVTTTIQEESGILVKLPEWAPEAPVTLTSEVLTVHLNADNRLMVEDNLASVSELPLLVKTFVLSPERTPRAAVVSLMHDRNTGYQQYLEVYDALLAGYRKLWDAEAGRLYGLSYDELSDTQRMRIRQNFPMVISEAEPSDIKD